MDPVICCLLGICCPPAQRVARLERVTNAFVEWGVERASAARCAKHLIDRIDASALGQFLQAVLTASKHDHE